MVKVTFCLVTDQQDITLFKNSKLVTACSSAGPGQYDRVLFRTFQHRLCYSTCNSEAFRLRIKALSSLCELQGSQRFQMHEK